MLIRRGGSMRAGAVAVWAVVMAAGAAAVAAVPPGEAKKPEAGAKPAATGGAESGAKPEAGAGGAAGAGGGGQASKEKSVSDGAYVLGYTVPSIDGKSVDLAQYKGRVVLIVNVASKCGYTPQYAGLEKLYEAKKDAGLVVLGFPANDFGRQEPGSNEEIAKFCESKFGVTFPMFAKIAVTGSEQHALYRQLSSQPAPIGGDPKWNFTKFLVDRNGRVVARFDSAVGPEAPELVAKVDELLRAKPAGG